MNICFLTKKEKPGVEEAINIIEKITSNIDVYDGSLSNLFPSAIIEKQYDLLISYISPWIVPKAVLEKTKRWNINFHPGPPDYPGIGCFNFAIYNSAKQFGATAHIMDTTVDAGRIVGVNRFGMTKKETVETLSKKTYKALLVLFKDVIKHVITNNSLPKCDEKWTKAAYKRSELEQLATIDLNMDKAGIDKRIRATDYQGKPAPFIELGGYRFEYNPDR